MEGGAFLAPRAQRAGTHHGGTTGHLLPAKKGLLSSQLKGCCSQGPQHRSSLIVVYRESNTKASNTDQLREHFASSWYSGKRISKQQGNKAKQKPWSQDCCVIWHILALPLILLQNLQGKAKASYLLIKVSHDSNIEQRTSPNRETCQPSCPCQQADVSVQCSPNTEWKSSGQWHIQMCTHTHIFMLACTHYFW